MGDVLYNEKVVPGEVLTMSYYKIKIGWRKVEMCGVGWGKWFWLSIIAHNMVARKRHSNVVGGGGNGCGLAGKSVINMIWLLLSISDWWS